MPETLLFMKPVRLAIAQRVCRNLPPLFAQRLRSVIYPFEQASRDDYEFIVRAQTGSIFKNTTSDYHAYPFSVHGYSDWRNWAIALALCSPGDTIVEVGANVGTETIGFADIVGSLGKVYAFEPLPSNLIALEDIMRLNQLQNVTILPSLWSRRRMQECSFCNPANEKLLRQRTRSRGRRTKRLQYD